jgi:hypothetical protein
VSWLWLRRLDDEAFDELAKDGAHTSWSELVKPTLAP